MKWGAARKPSSSSSSSSSSSGPFSWLSKFKQMRNNNSDSNHGKIKQKPKLNSTILSASSPPNHDHDGAFLRQSFDEELSQGDKKHENVIPFPSFDDVGRKNIDGKKHERRQQGSNSNLKLKEKDNGVTVEDERNSVNGDRKVEEYDREKEYENIRRRFEKKAQQVLEEQLLKLEREAKEVEEDNLLLYESSPKTICTPRTHSFATSSELKNSSSLRKIIEDRVSQKKMSSELKVKTEKQKPPPTLQRRKPKIRIYSPRMISKVEVCRIKALEDMRKAGKLKNNMKKEREEIVEETRPGSLDSFAVIKCSLDPRKDFRDSMIEMIMEKQISQAEEMEELLACYLTLNADEYHDLIIKVFRQVWFDMSQHGLDIKNTCSGVAMNSNL